MTAVSVTDMTQTAVIIKRLKRLVKNVLTFYQKRNNDLEKT
jgi:hypothetical protein